MKLIRTIKSRFTGISSLRDPNDDLFNTAALRNEPEVLYHH